MQRPPHMKFALTLITALTAASAQAHDGHGLWGAHWHASDGFGFVVLAFAVVVGAALWLSRK
jgi:hypothetical protein